MRVQQHPNLYVNDDETRIFGSELGAGETVKVALWVTQQHHA
jgi:hypothetical protein